MRNVDDVKGRSVYALTFDERKVEFETAVYIHAGRSMPLPAVHQLPEHKVKGMIHVDDLGLDDLGMARLAYMAGYRYDEGKRRLRLTCDYFPQRIENRRWILYTIEQLRRAAMDPDPDFDASYLAETTRYHLKSADKYWWGKPGALRRGRRSDDDDPNPPPSLE